MSNMQNLPLNQIHRSSTLNPRRHRNATRFEQLVESIRAQGVLQPIVVRPSHEADGQYEVVAGDSRFEASVIAELDSIPAVIRDLNDQEAKHAAATENLQRSDLSAIEESWVASDMMQANHQNHDETRKALGWSRAKLDNRLMLAHCVEDVSKALIDGDIQIGHAELLAPLSANNQASIVAKIIERGMSVKDTRERLKQVTRLIAKACFDTQECHGCVHNSASTFDLLATSVSESDADARCNNVDCWTQKTKAALDIIVTDAQRDYGAAHLDTEVSVDGYKVIEATGDQGLGTAQVEACASCEHYGAIISSGIGSEGRLTPGVCFNMTCHGEKRQAYQAMLADMDNHSSAEPEASQEAASEQPSATGKTSKAKTGQKKSSGESSQKPAELKKGMKRLAFNRFADITHQAIKDHPVIGLAISVVEMIGVVRSACDSKEAKAKFHSLMERYNVSGSSPASVKPQQIVELTDLGAKPLCNLLVELSALLAYRNDATDAFEKSEAGSTNLSLIDAFDINTAEWNAVDEAYLHAHTKAGIVADAKASGFAEQFDQSKGEGSFADLAKGKAADLVKGIVDFTDFDWTGYEPRGFSLKDYGKGQAKGEDSSQAHAA